MLLKKTVSLAESSNTNLESSKGFDQPFHSHVLEDQRWHWVFDKGHAAGTYYEKYQ